MDYKQIEQLLERYWQCETTLEEEQTLRLFFVNQEIPQHLLRYKELFVYQDTQREIGLDEAFDKRMLAIVEPTVVKAKRLTIMARFAPLFKAAAVVVFVVMVGNVIQHSLLSDRTTEYNYDNYVDTYDNSEAAYQKVSSALMIISEGLNKSKDLQLVDSLRLNEMEGITE